MASRMEPEGGWGSRLKAQKAPRRPSGPHLAFIRTLPCVACLASSKPTGGPACDAAHIRAGSRFHGKPATGMAEKPSDRWSLPLCRAHHDKQHTGNELNFWKMFGVDPFVLALILWGITGESETAEEVIRLHACGLMR